MTRVLFGRVFGIGNAVMSVGAIKHYRDTPGFEVTVVVGTTQDDAGALEVLRMIPGVRVWTDEQLADELGRERFDHGVLSIPHDGRWVSFFRHFCDRIWDGRTRPDPSTTGFVSWERHEAVYQLEVAAEVTGRPFDPETVDFSFWDDDVIDTDSVYLGVGYKRDRDGFWACKHWGDDNFVRFVRLVQERRPLTRVVVTGNADDMRTTGRLLASLGGVSVGMPGLVASMGALAVCGSYVGNDTGMMHVAASMGKPVVGIFNLEGTVVKNHPICPRWRAITGYDAPPSPELVYDAWMELIGEA